MTPAFARVGTYAYDPANRMTSATVGGGTLYNLRYDGLGRLYRTWGNGEASTYYTYDGDALIAEYSHGGTLLRRYIHGPGVDDPLIWYEGASTAASNRRFLHADERGSIVAITDNAGATVNLNRYDDWGIPSPGNIGRFQYTGQMRLNAIGLYYYKARMYSPSLGRFMQTDPIGYDDGMNMYAYVGNDPMNGTDPTGLFECEVPENCVTTRNDQADGSVQVDRTEVNTTNVTVGGTTIKVPVSTTQRGSIVLLPQHQSANGAPAVVTPDMQEALLDFSEEEGVPVNVTSGIRTPEQNARVGGASNSPHLSTNNDQAADISIAGNSPAQTAQAAFESGEFNRVNEYTDGRGVHVDLRPTGNQGLFRDWTLRVRGPR